MYYLKVAILHQLSYKVKVLRLKNQNYQLIYSQYKNKLRRKRTVWLIKTFKKCWGARSMWGRRVGLIHRFQGKIRFRSLSIYRKMWLQSMRFLPKWELSQLTSCMLTKTASSLVRISIQSSIINTFLLFVTAMDLKDTLLHNLLPNSCLKYFWKKWILTKVSKLRTNWAPKITIKYLKKLIWPVNSC